MSSLTDEQKRKIDENRQKALKLRAEKQKERDLLLNGSASSSSSSSSSVASSSSSFGLSPGTSFFSPFKAKKTEIPLNVCPGPFGNTSFQQKKLIGVCSLISRTRFIVNDIPYHKQLIDIFKEIPINKAKAIKSEVIIHPLPESILRVFENAREQREIPNVDLSCIDSALTDALYPFQYDGICFGIAKGGRVLLADDMGLGKTIQAIGIAAYYRKEWPLLVIAPSSVRYAWQMSFRNWLPSLPIDSLHVVNNTKEPIGKVSVLIISYDLVIRRRDVIAGRNFQVIIADECHFLKNFKTSRAHAILPLLKRAKRVCLLSGTPALSRPVELYTQVSAICPSVFPSLMDFGFRYCDAKKNNWGYDYSGATNMTELQIVMEEVLMIRRLKSEVLTQLPEKRREMVILDPSEVNTNTKRMTVAARKIGEDCLSHMQQRGALLEYFHETGSSKLKAICNYIEDLLESERKFLCFAYHKVVMDGICEKLVQKKCKHIRIDGKTTSEMRNQLCNKFQVNDSFRVAVLSITAANMGITLTSAQLVVFAELFWNPGILTQAEDRAHRIGQVDSVLVQYLVAKNTADDFLWPLVSKKLAVLNRAGLSKDNFQNADLIQLSTSTQQTLDKFVSDENLSCFEEVDWNNDNFTSEEEPQPKKTCM